MRILSLHIKNIGPFRDACLDFASDFDFKNVEVVACTVKKIDAQRDGANVEMLAAEHVDG